MPPEENQSEGERLDGKTRWKHIEEERLSSPLSDVFRRSILKGSAAGLSAGILPGIVSADKKVTSADPPNGVKNKLPNQKKPGPMF